MKRWLAKLLISRSVDSGKKLPAWIDQLIQRDESLRHHRDSMQSMVDQLRIDSAAFFSEGNQPKRRASDAYRRSGKRFAVTIAVAVVVLVAATLWQIRPTNPHEDIAEVNDLPMASDIELLEVAIAQPGKLANRLVAGASSLAKRTPTISRPDVANFTTKPVQEAGRKFGRMLAVLMQSPE